MTRITIPEELADRIEHRTQGTEFESVDEYASFVLSEVFTRIDHDVEEAYDVESADSPEEIEDRLKSLGYLED